MEKKPKKQYKVIQADDDPIATEVLANEIVQLSEGVRRLRAGRLTDSALVLLIQYAAPCDGRGRRLNKGDIESVLDAIESLEKIYLKPAKYGAASLQVRL